MLFPFWKRIEKIYHPAGFVITSCAWFFFCPGTRSNAEQTDLSEILPEDVEEQVKAAAEISMGTEVKFYFCGNNLVSYPLIEK